MLTPDEIDWIKDKCYPTRMETKVYLAEIARLAQIGRRAEQSKQTHQFGEKLESADASIRAALRGPISPMAEAHLTGALYALSSLRNALATPAPKPGEGWDLERHREAIRQALKELGVPSEATPAPVAEAVRILTLALCNGICPPCDTGENTDCICQPIEGAR